MKKILNYLKNNYVYVGMIGFFLLFNFGVSYWAIRDKYQYFPKDLKYFFILTMCLIIPIALIIFSKKVKKIENKFLLFFIVIGSLFMVGFPMTQTPDEIGHIYRAYEISEGHLASEVYENRIVGRSLPKDFEEINKILTYSDVKNSLDVKTGKERKVVMFDNTALYSFICYLPQTLGILFAKIFTRRLLVQLYFGRLFNFLVAMAMFYFAIKWIPIKKEVIFFIGLLPITMQESISLSPDALTIASSVLFISYILYLKNKQKEKIAKKDIALLAGLSIIISQCKIVYLPVLLLLFLLPDSKFASKKQKYGILLSLLAFVAILNLSWLKIASGFLKISSKGTSSKQIAYVLHHLFKYVLICINTINERANLILFQLFGKHLGWSNIKVPDIYVVINMILFIMMSLKKEKKAKFDLSVISKIIVFIAGLGVTALIATSLYTQWTDYKSPVIEGIQGRYFLPILMFVPLLIYKANQKFNSVIDEKYITLFITLQNICAFALIVIYYI